MQQPPPNTDQNTRIVVALICVTMVGFIGVTYPTLIPALALAIAAFMAIAVVLKL